MCYCGNDGVGTFITNKRAAPLNCMKVFGKLRCGVAGNEVADCLVKKVKVQPDIYMGSSLFWDMIYPGVLVSP